MKMSETTVELFKALSAFQKDVKQPKKDANNPFFKSKYVPLENVIEVIHEAAGKHGLAELTYPATSEDGTQHGVGVIITHSSGEFIEFPPVLLKPAKNDPQGVGAALTYSRRYALSAAFGIASETDDDGNSISGGSKPKPQPKKNEPKELSATENKIMNTLNEIEDLGGDRGKVQKEYLVREKETNFKNHAKLLGYLEGILESMKDDPQQVGLNFVYPEAKK